MNEVLLVVHTYEVLKGRANSLSSLLITTLSNYYPERLLPLENKLPSSNNISEWSEPAEIYFTYELNFVIIG